MLLTKLIDEVVQGQRHAGTRLAPQAHRAGSIDDPVAGHAVGGLDEALGDQGQRPACHRPRAAPVELGQDQRANPAVVLGDRRLRRGRRLVLAPACGLCRSLHACDALFSIVAGAPLTAAPVGCFYSMDRPEYPVDAAADPGG